MNAFSSCTDIAARVLSVGLVACGGEEQVSDAPAVIEEAPGVEEIVAVEVDQPARATSCDGLASSLLDQNGRAPCFLEISDGSGLGFDVTYEEADYGLEWTLALTDSDGNAFQTINETAEYVYGMPSMQDIDEDGADEVLVPLIAGNVNTNYAIWTRAPGEQNFVRAGEASGIGFEPAGDGLFSTPARSSASEWENSYYRLVDQTLTPVATMLLTLAEDGSNESCTVRDDGGLADAGLSLEEAEARFCAEAWTDRQMPRSLASEGRA